ILQPMGWGFAPIYVGQQMADPKKNFSTILTPAQGTIDAAEAASLATSEGFPANSVIFLDIESGGPLSPEMKAYATAWQQGLTNNNYSPGIYCSHRVLSDLQAAIPNAAYWIFYLNALGQNSPIYTPPLPDNDLGDSGYGGIAVWQYAQASDSGCYIQLNSTQTLSNVDLNVALTSDPSSIIPAGGSRFSRWLAGLFKRR